MVTVKIPKVGKISADNVDSLISQVRDTISANGYGASDVGARWPVRNAEGRPVGDLSYNGRYVAR